MSANPKSRRITRTDTIILHAPPERVFPLFGPMREAEWAEGWAPEIIYADTPLAEEEGAVFITRLAGEPETVWVVTRYDPHDYRIEYARITPGAAAVRVLILCEAAPGGQTTARVTYQITPLGEMGPHHNVTTIALVESHYPDFLKHWETAINRALAGRG